MSTLLRQLKGESQRYTNMASYGLGKLLGSAADRITELEESVRVDHAIASDYAMALFNLYYKDIADSIPLELCSTSGGVVTQIDNMVAGVMLDMAEEISELEKGYEELRMATLWAVQLMGGGQAKADLRDAYDKATEQLEALKEVN
jgi:hypothetical protein